MSEPSGASRPQNGSENRGIQRAAGGGTAAGGGRPAPATRCCERVFRIAGVLSPESRASPAKTRFRTSMITGVFGIDRRQTMTDARVGGCGAGCGSQWDNKRTAPVGSFNPNPFGLYDVLGNVTQWTKDCWNDNYDQAPSDGQARTTGNCDRRIARGGSWSGYPWVIRSATRFGLNAATRSSLTGFRVSKTLQ
jgi:hypothetical protein